MSLLWTSQVDLVSFLLNLVKASKKGRFKALPSVICILYLMSAPNENTKINEIKNKLFIEMLCKAQQHPFEGSDMD